MYKAYHRRQLRTLLIPLAVVLAVYATIGLWIGREVRDIAAVAQDRFPGDPVSALVAFAADEQAAPVERNRAVWALGQLGDPAALPLLERLHTRSFCQHEVRKAIRGCRGGLNLTAMVWRRGIART